MSCLFESVNADNIQQADQDNSSFLHGIMVWKVICLKFISTRVRTG